MNVSDVINGFVGGGLTTYIAYMFFSSFSRLKNSKKCLLWLIPVTIIISLSTTFFRGKIINIIITLLMTCFISFLFDMKWYNYILLSVSNIAISSVAELIVGTLMSLAFSISMDVGRTGIYYAIGMILSKFLSLIIVILIRAKKHKLLSSRYRKQFGIILIIPITTIAIILLQTKYFVQIPENDYLTLGIALVCYTTLIVSNVIVFDIIDNLCTVIIQDSKIAMVEELISQQSEQYSQFIEQTQEIQKIRHDYHNFLIGLSAELQANNIQNAITNIEREYNSVSGFSLPLNIESGNHTIDAFISAKQQVASTKNIRFHTSFHLPFPMKISLIDLAIMMGNAMDNAIEATEKIPSVSERIINISLMMKGNSLIITIINPVIMDVDVTDLKTTKKSTELHGFGIISMKNIASKYHGNVIFSCQNGFFTTTIHLNNSPPNSIDKHTNSADE